MEKKKEILTCKNYLKKYKARIWLAVFIFTLTTGSVAAFWHAYCLVHSFEVTAKWDNKDSVKLKGYPVWFYYNSKNKSISASRILSDSNKFQVLKLVDNSSASYYEFEESVSELAYKANKRKDDFFIYLLYLVGSSAVVGVQIRTIFDFIGMISYVKKLDIEVWWPWYFLRPSLGFLTGCLIIILIKAKLFTASTIDEDFSYVAIGAIAGFGVVEVIERLRLISKALFGDANTKTSTQDKTSK